MIAAPDIPGHTVTGVLGSGGFATVYRTWQVAVGRETAVKVDSRVLHTERDQRRFVREVTAAGRLSGHPNVIDVYDAGTLRDGRPYMVMELCPRGSLLDELRRSGPMSAAEVCHIGSSLADALAAAHAAGILHRDIKPANILINRYGVVGLSDFGLASIVAVGAEQSVTREALTPAYASPESFQAQEPTVAADIYSLGATLYALMAGRPPHFPADGKLPGMATIFALRSQPVEDIPGVPAGLLAILRQCLAADPAQRPPSAAALRDDLAAIARQPDISPARPAPPPPPPPPLPPPPHAIPSPSAHSMTPARAETGPLQPVGRSTHAAARASRWRSVALAVVAGGGLVLVIIAALIVGTHLRASGSSGSPARTSPARTSSARTGSGGTGSAGAIDTFGIPTTRQHCPAALVPGAGARCPAQPECWNGLVEIDSVFTAPRFLPCNKLHTWQTFAIAIMPSDVSSFDVDIVQASPMVRAVCSNAVMLRSRVGKARLIPLSQWSIQVVPPDETKYDNGVRTYRCLAALGYNESRTSQFDQ